jgi:hypothetical protein
MSEMPDINRQVRETGYRQYVTFHVDHCSPEGYIGTVSEDPATQDPMVWVFYADERVIALHEWQEQANVLTVVDPRFIERHGITPEVLETLFETARAAVSRPYDVLTNLPREDAIQPVEAHPTCEPGERAFRLDRRALAASLGLEDDDGECGLERFGDTPAEQVAGAVLHAEENGALVIPEGMELHMLKLDAATNAVALRETHIARRVAAGLPTERQVTTWSIELASLPDGDETPFGALCVTLEEVCREANQLLPSFHAMLAGEQLLSEPLTVLTYDLRARLASFRSSVEGITKGDPDRTRKVWPALVAALENGEGDEDWDGNRQTAYKVEPAGTPHLARQLVAARTELLSTGHLTLEALPDPERGFDAYLAE